MGTLDTCPYDIPNDLKRGIINTGVLQSLYNDINISFDELIKTIIINKELILIRPEPITITQGPLKNTDLNKLFEELR